ncbi:hypothetical protein RRG08_049870 [Elysia crispata]|uniref:Uncharacterized protein n=1 Tax=Elysia crispata TaxID=231223 RepID=A0AAE1CQ17_9GAST|nr:hypothetical protein RRG08_049870 [Elysia crispata]
MFTICTVFKDNLDDVNRQLFQRYDNEKFTNKTESNGLSSRLVRDETIDRLFTHHWGRRRLQIPFTSIYILNSNSSFYRQRDCNVMNKYKSVTR